MGNTAKKQIREEGVTSLQSPMQLTSNVSYSQHIPLHAEHQPHSDTVGEPMISAEDWVYKMKRIIRRRLDSIEELDRVKSKEAKAE